MTGTPTREGSSDRIRILGVPVDAITMDQCMDRIASFVRSGRPHLIATADSSGIVQAQTDPELKELYESADLVTPDSAGVVWALRRVGRGVPARVSGVDIVERACQTSASQGWRIYFLGAAQGVAEEAAERMRLRYPGCAIVGARDGYFPPERDQEVAEEIAATKPDLLFVAMGIPRQEKFIRATEATIGAKVAMGVGGTFDVFSGRVRRAPKALQAMRLEWAWRLAQNPKKIDKVRLLPQFVGMVIREGR